MPLRLSLIFLIILNIANTVMFSTPFKITNYNIYSDKINGSIKIAFISDLHLKEYGDDNSILLKEISNLNPDIIAVAGDSIIYNENDHSSAIKFLNNSAKIAPTYFSPGNHEWSQIYTKRDKQLYNDLRNSDGIYLSNEVSKLEINGKIYTVEDRGGAIQGKRLDIYFDSHQEALNFGRKTAVVYKLSN